MTDAPDVQLLRGLDSLEAALNRDCFCIDVDPSGVWSAVEQASEGQAAVASLRTGREHLFSGSPVFLSAAQIAAMGDIVNAIEATAGLASYQDAVLDWAPPIARAAFGPRGAFMGYDFHLAPDGPKLIEINTNAGGAFLNALLAQAQVACCPEVQAIVSPDPLGDFEAAVWAMFQAEWRAQGRAGQPATVAIVDETPQEQYLYPEFLLARAFFARRGVEALIVDPGELQFAQGRLSAAGRTIDLVYNRLVDFAFDRPASAELRRAYLEGAVVVTPNPRNHAILADKRNLCVLSDQARLAALGVEPDVRRRLSGVPETRMVTAEEGEALWAARKGLFFKPAGGHAGKAVYRGDKLTRGVWSEVLKGGYVAQAYAEPGLRRVQGQAGPEACKMDVRLYTYGGEVLLAAARLYQGQTTNFRTPGGGFAPVIALEAPGARNE